MKIANSLSFLCVAATVVLASVAHGDVDRITLRDGREVAAPIVKQTSDTIWVDLGFDILAIPRADIEAVLRAEVDPDVTELDEDALYRTATGLPESTPQELAKRIGEAVIKVSTPSGLGSGFIIHPDGYAITNAHVIQGETRIKATVFHQTEREFRRLTIDDVEILAVNNHNDLALIKLKHPDGEQFSSVYVQGAENLDVGEDVFAIGNPLGLERTLSRGVVVWDGQAPAALHEHGRFIVAERPAPARPRGRFVSELHFDGEGNLIA